MEVAVDGLQRRTDAELERISQSLGVRLAFDATASADEHASLIIDLCWEHALTGWEEAKVVALLLRAKA